LSLSPCFRGEGSFAPLLLGVEAGEEVVEGFLPGVDVGGELRCFSPNRDISMMR
jgi:hypothetical protein